MNRTRKLLTFVCIGAALLTWQACDPKGDPAAKPDAAEPPATNSPAPPVSTNTPVTTNAATATNATAAVVSTNANTNLTVTAAATVTPPSTSSDTGTNATAAAEKKVQVSFRGSNIDAVIQWLAKTTDKSVVKHPQARVSLTIVSSRELPVREAIALIYRAMELEGITTIENANTILIFPTKNEPKLSPEFIGRATTTDISEGRRRIVKIFEIKHGTAAELSERCKAVLTEKAKVEVDPRGNKLIVTDYTDNIRVLEELLPMLDVPTDSDQTIELYPLKHLDADDLSGLLGMILKQDDAKGSSSSKSKSKNSSRSSSPSTVDIGAVKIWPDRTTNRLIVAAPRSKQQEIKDLIELLDTEKPEDVGVRVLPLKHLDAQALVREIAPLYRKLGGQSLKEAVEISANERSNSLMILSSLRNFEKIRTFVEMVDTKDAHEQVMETILLMNADAEDVATQLKSLIENKSSSSSSRYYSSRYGSSSPDKKMNIVADRRRNSVIVMGSPEEIEGLRKMIKVLDEPLDDDSLVPTIRQLQYVNAVDIESVLNELFVKKVQGRGYWDYYEDSGTQDDTQNVGRLNGKVRITSEPYSNSIIIAANSKESLEAVEEILDQLDVPSTAGDSTLRIQLNFAKAIEIANSVNVLFAKDGSPPMRGTPQQNQQNQQNQRNQQQSEAAVQSGFELVREREADAYFPWLGGQQGGRNGRIERPASELVGRVRAVPDKRSNSLLVTADVQYLQQVVKLVRELDAPTAQVLIDCKIIEVSSDFRDKLGTRWAVDGAQAFSDDDRDGAVQATLAASFMDVLLGSAANNSFRSGIIDSSVNIDMLVQFLRKNTDATVLAHPKISVSDNEMGRLFVGSRVPFISKSLNTDQGGRNDSFQYVNVGIILDVTPSIKPSGEIALSIRAESSSIRSGETLFGGAIIDARNFKTDLILKSGQTVVLGGIIQKEEGEVIRKVPFLGDIPFLGWAFKKKEKTDRKVELMVLLRTVIVRSQEEADALLNDVESTMPSIKAWHEKEKKIEEETSESE